MVELVWKAVEVQTPLTSPEIAMQAVTKDDFQTEVIESKTPVLVDFWAPWCAPCKALTPVLESLTSIRVVSVNADLESGLAEACGVRGLPTVIRFENGNETGRVAGSVNRQTLVDKLGV